MSSEPMTGAVAANPHEGSRSEYLAQYVFSRFGTCVSVPHHEDHGIDMYCTLLERRGKRAWPIAYYSIQVKSNFRPWIFASAESVRWLIDYPMPLFYCIVEKKTGWIYLYQTLRRFGEAIPQVLPDRLSLVPDRKLEGRPLGGTLPKSRGTPDPSKRSLSAPILKFKVDELLDAGRFLTLSQVLEYWVRVDLNNVWRYQSGMRRVTMPWRYVTNEVPAGGEAKYSLTYATPDILAAAEDSSADLLDWLGEPRLNATIPDRVGALLAALALRHYDKDWTKHLNLSVFTRLLTETQLRLASGIDESDTSLFGPFDMLLSQLEEKVQPRL